MPSKTFLRLDQEKQKQILACAKKEFSSHRLKDASINRIVKAAGISRGSFYMYFQDIEDIYTYLIQEISQNTWNILGELLHKNKGDLYQSFLSFFDILLNLCSKDEALFKNVYLNMNLYMEGNTETKKSWFNMDLFKEQLDLSSFTSLAQENLFFVHHLFFRTVIENVILVVHFQKDKEEVRKNLEKQLTILTHGIYQKGGFENV